MGETLVSGVCSLERLKVEGKWAHEQAIFGKDQVFCYLPDFTNQGIFNNIILCSHVHFTSTCVYEATFLETLVLLTALLGMCNTTLHYFEIFQENLKMNLQE